MSTQAELEDFILWAEEMEAAEIEERCRRPWVRLWDGDWNYRGQVANENSGSWTWINNETGPGTLVLPIDEDDEDGTYLAYWALDEEARGTKNIHVTVDKSGARWGGRMKSATLNRDPKGDNVTIEFLNDYEELKNVHCAPNPFLPLGIIQQPKTVLWASQVITGSKLLLLANLGRLKLTDIAMGLGAALLAPSYINSHTFTDWQIVVKPHTSDPSPFAFFTGKMKSWHDLCAPKFEDAEVTVVTRRWLTGDPPAWSGAPALRNGTLVVDIVDKSGFRTGTSIGGDLMTGLARSVANLASNNVEDEYDLISTNPIVRDEYRVANWLGTIAPMPHVIYRDGYTTGIQSSNFTITPPGPARITAGGRSMPGVNEIISAAVNYAGDVLGDNISIAGYGIGSLGSAIDSFLNPIYTDSILAWTSVPLILRAIECGWGHYLETVASGNSQAYTPSTFGEIRKRRRETDGDTTFTLSVLDALPFLIGDNGQGDWWVGDRIGATNKHLGTRVFVKRAQELTLSYSADQPQQWKAELADVRTPKDVLEKVTSLAQEIMGGLQEAGAMG